MALPKIQPSGGTPTTKDFVSLQTQWASQINPVLQSAAAGDGIPVGAMFNWPTSVAPDKFLTCSGQVLLGSQYTSLYRLIGPSFNTGGEPPGWFRLPAAAGTYALIIKYLP